MRSLKLDLPLPEQHPLLGQQLFFKLDFLLQPDDFFLFVQLQLLNDELSLLQLLLRLAPLFLDFNFKLLFEESSGGRGRVLKLVDHAIPELNLSFHRFFQLLHFLPVLGFKVVLQF